MVELHARLRRDHGTFTVRLFGATIILLLAAVLAFHWRPVFIVGFVLAGAAGSCVSVMAKMPLLDVGLSGELEGYARRIFSRIGAGVIGSMVGCALLGWGVIAVSFQGHSFADTLSSCSGAPMSCTALNTLIPLAVPLLLGFSERALTSFEHRLLGTPSTASS